MGKFAPHTTSLMVNPQLEPNSQAASTDINYDTMEGTVRKNKKQNHKRQLNANGKRKVILLSDDDISCDSGLVVDIDAPKTKRKYTRRKPKEKVEKLSNDSEISNTGSLDEINDQVKASDQQKTTDLTNQLDSKSEIHDKKELTSKKLKKQSAELAIPRVKRKYVKRKLVRKKYTRRKPKENGIDIIAPQIETNYENSCESFPNHEQSSESFTHTTDSSEEFDIWIDLETDVGIENFSLLNEEVDNFWDSIEDPNSLFMELEIE